MSDDVMKYESAVGTGTRVWAQSHASPERVAVAMQRESGYTDWISITADDAVSLGEVLVSLGRRARPRYYAQMAREEHAYTVDRGAERDKHTIVATFEGPDCLVYAERHAVERNGETK